MNITERLRPDWDQYGMILAYAAATRSPDPYVTVGAVAFREDHSTVATGYNGAQKGVEIDWTDRNARRPFVVHAERNCLEHAGVGEVHSLYVTLSPCSDCIELMAAHGVKEVIYDEVYDKDPLAFEKAKQHNIVLRQLTLADDYKKTLRPQL
jgi:dCMP deaminase